jgi:SAM-dependent methyltransferase
MLGGSLALMARMARQIDLGKGDLHDADGLIDGHPAKVGRQPGVRQNERPPDSSDRRYFRRMMEYDQIVDWYARNRNRAIGIGGIDAITKDLPAGARILDIGCGDGIPLTRYLADRGLEVFGVDSSARMLERFRSNVPEATVQYARAQDSDFFGLTFDAAIAWGILFHLSDSDQEKVITKAAATLRPGGILLFTSGEEDGVRTGKMDNVEFSYRSLGVERYARILATAGLDLVSHHSDRWDNHVYVSSRSRS